MLSLSMSLLLLYIITVVCYVIVGSRNIYFFQIHIKDKHANHDVYNCKVQYYSALYTRSGFKLLMNVSRSQESLLEDHLLLTNQFNLHVCCDYCFKCSKSIPSKKNCRMDSPSSCVLLLH